MLFFRWSCCLLLLYSLTFFCWFSWLQTSVRSSRHALLAHEIKRGWDLVQNRKATHTWFQRLREYLRFWEKTIYVHMGLPENENFRKLCFVRDRNKGKIHDQFTSLAQWNIFLELTKWQERGWQIMIQPLCYWLWKHCIEMMLFLPQGHICLPHHSMVLG